MSGWVMAYVAVGMVVSAALTGLAVALLLTLTGQDKLPLVGLAIPVTIGLTVAKVMVRTMGSDDDE